MGDALLNAILEWMQNNHIRIASYERIVSSVPGAATYDQVAAVVGNYPGIFRTARIRGGIPGLALVDGYSFPHVVTPGPSLSVGDLNTPATPVEYAEPAQAPVGYNDSVGLAKPATQPMDESSYADYATSAPTSTPARDLTPHEAVVKLLTRAANSDVSGSALNYANAAVAAATARQLLDDVG